jgi:hypothetical protein
MNTLDMNTFAAIRMDYKIELMSKYITNKMCELSGTTMEVGFCYGGSVKRDFQNGIHTSKVHINDIYVPTKQRITGVDFEFSLSAMCETLDYFTAKKTRITGIGHSHGHLDVFHSDKDHRNCDRIVTMYGMMIQPREKYVASVESQSFSTYAIGVQRNNASETTTSRSVAWRKLRKHNRKKTDVKTHTFLKPVVTKKLNKPRHFLPSFVYNTKDQTNRQISYNDGETNILRDGAIVDFYNKDIGLTLDEKISLDKKVFDILAYNKMRPVVDRATYFQNTYFTKNYFGKNAAAAQRAKISITPSVEEHSPFMLVM